MRNLKKFLCLMMSLVLVLFLSGCGSKDTDPTLYGTPVPTASPVPTATPPVVLPFVTYSPVPTPTPAPTPIPTPKTTQNPGPENLKRLQEEIQKISHWNEIVPSEGGEKKRDFYQVTQYWEMTFVDSNELYNVLKDVFTNCIAHSIQIEFSYDGSAESRLQSSLNSAVCSHCGRLKMIYKEENTSEMEYLMSQISDRNTANRIMLDFIQEHTSSNSKNSNDRLTITCAGH